MGYYSEELDKEIENLLDNNEFKTKYEGVIPPNEKGKFHKKNKNCNILYQNLVEITKKKKEEDMDAIWI